MDTLGIDPKASRMLSGCKTITPRAPCETNWPHRVTFSTLDAESSDRGFLCLVAAIEIHVARLWLLPPRPASRSVGPVPRVRQCGAEPCLQNSLCQAFLAKWLVPGPACSKALLTTPLVPGIAQDIVGARSCSPNCWCQALLAARPCLHHCLSEVLIAALLVPCLARTNVGAKLRLQQSLTYSFVGARPCLQKWFEDQSLSASPHI